MSGGELPMQTGPLALLDRLNGVIKSGRGWRAECPACGGRSKKLAIAEATTGAVLLRCHAGCSALHVVEAVGLSLTHLFPAKVGLDSREQRLANRRALRDAGINAAIQVLAHEAHVVTAAGFEAAHGRKLTFEDLERLELAMQRFEDAKLVLCER